MLCIAFSHIESCANFASTSKTRGRTSSCSPTHKPIHLPQNSHHTYLPQHFHSCSEIYCHATSILHYKTCCHLSFIYCFARFYIADVWFTHVTLDHCISCYTGRVIQFTSCFSLLWVICNKKCVVILECCPWKWKEPWRPSKRETEKEKNRKKGKKKKRKKRGNITILYPHLCSCFSTCIIHSHHLCSCLAPVLHVREFSCLLV